MSTLIPTTAEEAATRLLDLDLIDPISLNKVWADLGGTNVPLETMCQALLRRELLTRYQVERMLKGERYGFFYGRAKVLYQVGAGSFARVYRAVDRVNGSIVAVKVLRNRYSNDPGRRAAFQREGATGRLLEHPNIVRIEDVGQEHGFSFITMEFVEGQNLRELIRLRGALDVPRALELMKQIATGLEFAHGKGVTHRDMKASNVLVSSSGVAKLVDFGLAGVAGATDKSLATAMPRTLDYATLEKVSKTQNDAVKCDIYFLGTLAYLALAGVPALGESRDRAVRADPQRYLSVVPLNEAAPRVPREVVQVVAKMMHLDASERMQTSSDARRAIEALLSQMGSASPEPGGPREPSAATPVAASAASSLQVSVAKPEEPSHAARPVMASGPRSQPTVMLVEKSRKSQESLRRFLEKIGYRVLLTESPQRAITRFESQPLPADCLVISAQELADEAVAAFNRLTSDRFLNEIPAILIAGTNQKEVLEAANFDDRRRLLQIPISSEKMVSLLESLIPSTASGSPAAVR
ncbi:MAG: protein kinase domain-containing protein [Planctomycetia bacterium]